MAMSPWVSASCWADWEAVLGERWEQILYSSTQVASEITKFSQSNNKRDERWAQILQHWPLHLTLEETSQMSLRISLEKGSPPNEYCHNPSFWTYISTSVSQVKTVELGSGMVADKCLCAQWMRGRIYTSQQLSCYLFGLGLKKPPGELHREASSGVKMSLEVESTLKGHLRNIGSAGNQHTWGKQYFSNYLLVY